MRDFVEYTPDVMQALIEVSMSALRASLVNTTNEIDEDTKKFQIALNNLIK